MVVGRPWAVWRTPWTTSAVVAADGSMVAEGRYLPYGGQRWNSGTSPTDYRFTGQRQNSSIPSHQMGVRCYDIHPEPRTTGLSIRFRNSWQGPKCCLDRRLPKRNSPGGNHWNQVN
jgi:hypothetical protein